MKRIVITGFGIISSIGNSKKEIIYSLQNSVSGISFSKNMKNFGLRSNIWGDLNISAYKNILPPKKFLRFMNDAAYYAFWSMGNAIQDSKLLPRIYEKNPRVGLIIGSGSGSPNNLFNMFHLLKNCNNPSRMGPYVAIKNMTSSISAILGAIFKIYGINYSISSACATSANCIGHAVDLISLGKQDIVFAGGSEELSLELACQFDSMRVLSTKFNDNPVCASRAFDLHRDGFVISGGSGIIVLEELNFALSRHANIYAEMIGYGSTCDGSSLVKPSGKGAERSMRYALKNCQVSSVDYLNAHGTSTKTGDIIELNAIKKFFLNIPLISSTKSITGHSLGAAGVQEIIYIILMLNNNFIAPSTNIDILDPLAKNMNIVRKYIQKTLSVVMSNSFGFGGINVSLVLRKYS
ncbi:3-oxoacyl-[acyl-carrier-protein] synthase I [Buchnera aphidicola (Cinara tujafilina)]|uniref:3-oxoacyl-[acyl-carrier-protein] synthase 1 n=1 Tax=Buchnera aphidicola (Cinara tujafilina) TaxID=261317 RepID=F7WYZ9_9GAMM|nr:beta-ketoacyl synthase N-terminal-like domain-containing protein [Buchnera aphidicola]AEH39649.1 3-oxoacyl-[acyl-carrier-protein] synthase I [Buchnera aphidicola (Cinara tujafilina)]